MKLMILSHLLLLAPATSPAAVSTAPAPIATTPASPMNITMKRIIWI